MQKTKVGELVFTEQDIFQHLYQGKLIDLELINIEDGDWIEQFNKSNKDNYSKYPIISKYIPDDLTVEEYDKIHQSQWLIPEYYQQLDIEQLIISLCKTNQELERVNLELKLYKERNLLNVLRCLKYLVDTMRENKIIWGVGRGSSTASYVLFLLGVHKINSIKFELPITEFLK